MDAEGKGLTAEHMRHGSAALPLIRHIHITNVGENTRGCQKGGMMAMDNVRSVTSVSYEGYPRDDGSFWVNGLDTILSSARIERLYIHTRGYLQG